MTRIGLLSDTHSFLDTTLQTHFADCQEIWHAGDFGNEAVIAALEQWGKPVRGVYGNIDAPAIRHRFPEVEVFACEDVKVMMLHIGGYPGKYPAAAKARLLAEQPQLYITGHSHILKAMRDPVLQLLHLNPGAAGHEGWHKMRTAMRFVIDGAHIQQLEVIELGKRGYDAP